MRKFKKGDRVHIEYDGVVGSSSNGEEMYVVDPAGSGHYYSAELYDSFSVTTPVNWPPEDYDVWKANDGSIWVALYKDGLCRRDSFTILYEKWLLENPDGELLFRVSK